MFELMQLRCFVAVAEELHFGRAALRLNMTQPPLSRQVQILERLLSVELLRRTSRSVQLTAAGKAFLLDARRIVKLAESATLRSQRAASGEIGAITLGFTAASGYSYLPRLVAHARSALPGIDVNLKEMVSVEQIEALLSGQIDIGLLRPPLRRPEFDSLHVLREGLLIATPSQGIDGREGPRTIADFDEAPTIMYSPDGARYFYDLLAGIFSNAGVAPRHVQYVSQIHSMLALVGAGLGSALVPEAARALHFDGVEFREVATPELPVELLLVWRRENDSPALERFVASMRELVETAV